ncbi:MAG: lysine biosynthesis protein LysW [Candidatus Freyarchaeota archaeon]|nr:lysine biosynthesis protein LysW [Candidatus Jordarchaeia archaeon]
MKATCPECYFEFDVEGEVMIGEIIDCPDCGMELEVVSIDEDKIILQTVSVEEDWGE